MDRKSVKRLSVNQRRAAFEQTDQFVKEATADEKRRREEKTIRLRRQRQEAEDQSGRGSGR